ncbi:MAG: hypothetical protein V4651_06365 [Bacteroidota bacterium]
MSTIKPITPSESEDTANESFSGYPAYPVSEDIYNQLKEEQEIDPDDIQTKKAPVYSKEEELEPGDETNRSGDFLDVPGAELDDAEEIIGNEDEENNYYSLGGDNHNDLEEDQGE